MLIDFSKTFLQNFYFSFLALLTWELYLEALTLQIGLK